MSERLMLEGALQQKRLAASKLAARAAGIIVSLKMIIQPASITQLKDLRTAEAVELCADLHQVRGEYMALKSDIDDIEKELGIR